MANYYAQGAWSANKCAVTPNLPAGRIILRGGVGSTHRLQDCLARSLIVLPHVLSPSLDLLGLLFIHPSDFVSGVTKCVQDFI